MAEHGGAWRCIATHNEETGLAPSVLTKENMNMTKNTNKSANEHQHQEHRSINTVFAGGLGWGEGRRRVQSVPAVSSARFILCSRADYFGGFSARSSWKKKRAQHDVNSHPLSVIHK